MNLATVKSIMSALRIATRATLAVWFVAGGVVMLSALPASGQDPASLIGAASAIADKLPTDVVRLAVITSIISQTALVVFFLAQRRADRLMLQKPCILTTAAGKAVVREFLRDGARRPVPQED